MVTSKNYIFTVFFYYKSRSDRERAERTRIEVLLYLKRLLEGKTRFSAIARDENRNVSCLMLRGYINLRNACQLDYAKKLIGRYSRVKASVNADVIHLMRLWSIDKEVVVSGNIPAQGNNKTRRAKSYQTDARTIMRILNEEIANKDYDETRVDKSKLAE